MVLFTIILIDLNILFEFANTVLIKDLEMTSQKLWKNESNIQSATACYCMEFLKQENTDELCIKAMTEHLDLDINNKDIDRTHRIWNPRMLMKNQDL